MMGSYRREAFVGRCGRVGGAAILVLTMVATSMVLVGVAVDTASARGPAYPGPQTTAESPAYFGPAPNPFPYCDNPTYFDPWEENVTPTGRLDVGDTAMVTSDGMTMVLEIEAEGDPGGQYPGFFPFGGEGAPNDRAKGFEVASGDSASVTLSQPLFYAQFIFTDVDQPGEGFEIVPDWAIVGEVIAYGGDGQFTFDGTTNQRIVLDDLDGVGHPSESVNGRAQLDMLGAVNGITFTRPATRIDPDTGLEIATQGQSGLSVAGGCEASGAAKQVVSGPTWNGDSFEVTYELRVRNNMPTAQTIQDVVAQAQANAQTTFSTAPPTSIPLAEMRLQDQLADPAFSEITVTDRSTTSPNLILNDAYNGLDDDELLAAGSSLAAESDAVVTLTVEYTPDPSRAEWVECTTGYDYVNQSEVSGTVGGIAVSDLSDDGVDPTPSSNNGSGDVDDPTPVLFPCLPAGLDIVKTAINGPNGTCPTFANGVPGDGPTLPVIVDDVVTYCISVENAGLGTANDVTITDPQAPNAFAVGTLQGGQGQTVAYDVQVDLTTPGVNTATATGTSALGDLGPVSDTARISVSPRPQPDVQIVKTVLPGPNATCPDFDAGVPGRGTPLPVDDGDIVTYCISVRNDGPGDALAVVVSDVQAPQDFAIGTLATTESATVSYDLTVTLASPTVNIAFADGDGPDGPFDQVNDDAEIDVSPLQPDLDIVKTVVAGPNGACPTFAAGVPGPGLPLAVVDGDTVTYCVSVINAGPGVAANVVVTDVQVEVPFDIGTLVSGAEQTVSYDVQVTLQTPDTNTAMANGEGPDGALDEVSDVAVIAVDRQPEPVLEIVKTAIAGANITCPDFADGTPGRGAAVPLLETETVTYCVTVRNAGDAPASNVLLSDDQAPNGFDLSVGDLAPSEEATRSYELVVSLQTIAINVAFADGEGPYGPVDQVSDDAEIVVSLQPDPVLEIVKTAVIGPNGTCPDFANGVVGDGPALAVLFDDVVTFCLAITNSGENTAQSVQVSDPQAPGVFSIGTVAVGEEVLRSYDITVDAQTEVRNTATVTGVGPNGQLPAVSDTALIDPAPQPDPVLEIVKTAVEGPNGTCPEFDQGVPGDGDALAVFYEDVVTYCISVRNSGERSATTVVVVDAQAPGSFDIGELQVDEVDSVSYDITVDAQTAVLNTATVNGSGPNGDLPEASDTALIDPSPIPEPELEIVKTVVVGPNGACPAFAAGVAGPGTPLQVTDGDTVTYCVSVLNSGPGVATSVVIADPQAPASFDIGTLASQVGQTVSYDIQVSLQTPETNTAVATGDGPTGALDDVSDDAVIAVNRLPEPQLEIVKTAVRGSNAACPDFAAGTPGRGASVQFVETETVTYCLTVRNVGAGAATNVVLSDDQAPNAFDLTVGDLAVGAEVTRSFELVVSLQTEAINIAFADGDGPYGPVRPVNDDAEISVSLQPDPVLEIVKTVVEGPGGSCPDFANGVDGDGPALPVLFDDVVTYCLAVTNTGENDAESVQVSDPQAPGLFSVGVVAVGQEVLRSYDITVDAQTEQRNTATVSGVGPNGQLPEDTDSALIDSSPQPDPVLDIVKTVVEGPNGTCPGFDAGVVGDGDALAVFYGDVVTYCITVRNSGERAAVDVIVTDAQAPQTYDVGTLAVDAAATMSYDITIDAQTEELNTATVTGSGPNGELPEESDTALIDPSPQPDPQLNIVKTVVLGPAGTCPSFDDGVTGVGDALRVELGDTVTYCISVRNTGARDAVNVVIADEQAPGPFDIGTLAVGETVDRSYDLVIDIDTPLVNIAVVTGEGPNGELPEDEDDARINTADIELVHTVIRAELACEDTVEDVDILVVDLEGIDVLWCYRITNTGNVPLTNIALSSSDIGFVDLDVLENAERSFSIGSSGELLVVGSAPATPAGIDGAIIGSANVEPGAVVLMPGETVSVDVATLLPGGGLISNADVVADPSDNEGNLLGLPEVTDVDDAEVREGLIQLDKTVAAGVGTDCALAAELVVVPVGDPVTWCFTVTNIGSLDLEVTEIVDETLTIMVPVPDEFRVLTPGMSFTVSASGAAPGAIINLASVEGLALDPAGDVIEQAPVVRDDDTAEIRLPQADMSIDKAVSNRGPVRPGTVLTYTLLVSNNGPDAAAGVEVADVLPAGLQYAALPSTDGWACSLEGSQGFRCSRAADMASGASATLIYTVLVESDAPRGVPLENVATVDAITDDPDPTNNTDRETTSTDVPGQDEELDPQPEYPGPFTVSDPPVDPPDVPDEVLGLAITGSSSRQLGLLSAVMFMLGALLIVGSRRSRDRKID